MITTNSGWNICNLELYEVPWMPEICSSAPCLCPLVICLDIFPSLFNFQQYSGCVKALLATTIFILNGQLAQQLVASIQLWFAPLLAPVLTVWLCHMCCSKNKWPMEIKNIFLASMNPHRTAPFMWKYLTRNIQRNDEILFQTMNDLTNCRPVVTATQLG